MVNRKITKRVTKAIPDIFYIGIKDFGIVKAGKILKTQHICIGFPDILKHLPARCIGSITFNLAVQKIIHIPGKEPETSGFFGKIKRFFRMKTIDSADIFVAQGNDYQE
jgi:hypothetical protein